MVSLFVLKAGSMVERHQTVGERARVTPTTQTGLERDRQTKERKGDNGSAWVKGNSSDFQTSQADKSQ